MLCGAEGGEGEDGRAESGRAYRSGVSYVGLHLHLRQAVRGGPARDKVSRGMKILNARQNVKYE